MTMNAMVLYLEGRGFKVHKEYSSTERAYEFTIERNGLNLTGWFEYKGDGKTVWKAQEDFLDKMVRDFEQLEKEKKSMKNIAFDISRDGPVGKLVIKDNVYDVCVKEVDSYSSPYDTNTVLKVEVSGKNLFEPKCATRTDGVSAQFEAYKKLNLNCATPYNPYYRKDSINDGKLQIKDVIFNPPATIVFWSDGEKTVVKAENEVYDPEKGLAMAIAKRAMGNQGNYFETFKKYVDRYKKKIDEELAAKEAKLQAEQKKPYRIWYKDDNGDIKTFNQRTYVREANALKAAHKMFDESTTQWIVTKKNPVTKGDWKKIFGSDS